MKFKGTLIGPASGKLNGVVASRNAGGQYFRKLTIPTNPNSPQQAVIRQNMALLTNAWNNTLTALQRAAWNVYASNVTVLDSLGDAIKISGIAQYIRSNSPRLQASMTRIDDAPTTFNTGDFTTPTISSLTSSTGIMALAFTTTDAWANTANNAMLVYMSRPQNPSISFFKGPYRFAGKIVGAATPPTSPASITAPFPFAVGTGFSYACRSRGATAACRTPFSTSALVSNPGPSLIAADLYRGAGEFVLTYDTDLDPAGGSQDGCQIIHAGAGHNALWLIDVTGTRGPANNRLTFPAAEEAFGSSGSPTFYLDYDPVDGPKDIDGNYLPSIAAGTPYTDNA